MTQLGCYQSVKVCATRSAELDASGAPLEDMPMMGRVNGSAYNLNPRELSISPVVRDGQRIEVENGCGDICVTFEDCDKITNYELEVTLCDLDLEYLLIHVGGTAILTLTDTTGWIHPPLSAACPNGVEFNFWTQAWDTSQQVAAPFDYWHWVFPKTTWTVSDWDFENDALEVTLSGKSFENANIGDGAGNDLPAGIVTNFGVFLASDIPVAGGVVPGGYTYPALACGFVDTPIQP
jgi:hypothetical protein